MKPRTLEIAPYTTLYAYNSLELPECFLRLLPIY